MDASTIGNFISMLRKEKGLTQKELANKLNVSDKAISRWETGKGYPDIETLPVIAEFFNISISELLNGKINEKDVLISNSINDETLYDVCIVAKENNIKRKKQLKKLKLSLIIISVLLVFSVLTSFITSMMVREYNNIVGSENCVIANDYSSLNFFGTKYIPIIVPEGADIKSGDNVLVKEAQVEGYGYFAKLPFGEVIYDVNGIDNNDIVYLQTNGLTGYSRFFCIADKYDEYYNMLNLDSYVPEDCFCMIELNFWDFDFKTINNTIMDDVTDLVHTAEGVTAYDISTKLIYSFETFTYEEDYSVNLGEFKIFEEGIYFCPSIVFSQSDEKLYYKLDDKLSNYLFKLFSYDYNFAKEYEKAALK